MFRKIILIGLTVFAIAAGYFLITKSGSFNEGAEPPCVDVDVPILVYGINVDTLDITLGEVQANQSLSGLLDGYSVGYSTIHQLVQNAKNVYDVRRLRPGDDFVIIHSKGEIKRARQFIIQPNDREYVIYHLADSIYAERIQRRVDLTEKEVAGEINSSVYVTAVNNGGSPELVSKLVDVFAWQIDFFRVQKGDKFKVIYEEESVGGKSVGMRRILAAYFEHFGKPFYAIYFDECGGRDYYDECGNSVRRAFLKAPLNYSRISSRYSPSRFHPVLKRFKAHLGTDYAAPTGTPIQSVGSGVVLEAQYKGGNGNYVKVRHNSTYTTQYLHMSKIATGIRPGMTVNQGQTIGYVGSTGLATGPHLCFRFWKNGKQVDALRVDLPPAKPVDPSGLIEYDLRKEIMVTRLDAIPIASQIRKAEAKF